MKKNFVLNENFYGGISFDKTKKVLNEIKEQYLEHINFPINDFCGNAALFLSIFSDNVSAINATSDFPVKLDLQKKKLNFSDFDGFNNKQTIESIQNRIVSILNKGIPFIEELFLGKKLGERPTIGLVSGMPYDYEVLSRYIYAGGEAKGRVLEIGCGLGYGAYSIVELNPDTKVMYEDVRRGANFERVINNIRWLITERNSLGLSSPFVEMQFVVTSKNKHEIPLFKSLCDGLGVDNSYRRYSFIRTPGTRTISKR